MSPSAETVLDPKMCVTGLDVGAVILIVPFADRLRG
jgi:hypothetical protein